MDDSCFLMLCIMDASILGLLCFSNPKMFECDYNKFTARSKMACKLYFKWSVAFKYIEINRVKMSLALWISKWYNGPHEAQ
jgi:hypothetical protein